MSEPGFREVQLNTKQVVFLFIAGVAVLVSVFLLGVSVGKGVAPERPGDAVQQTDPAADVTASGVMPPATSPKPDELKYHDDLRKGVAKGAAAPPTPPDAPPDSAAKPTPTVTAAPQPTAKPAAPPSQTSKPAPQKAAGTIYLQVNSFGQRANADRQVAQLKAIGIPASVYESGPGGARFKVRVGPYADNASMETMRARLKKEGFNPSVTR